MHSVRTVHCTVHSTVQDIRIQYESKPVLFDQSTNQKVQQVRIIQAKVELDFHDILPSSLAIIDK